MNYSDRYLRQIASYSTGRRDCNAPQKGCYHPICLHDAPQLSVDAGCN